MNREAFIQKLFAKAREAGFQDCEACYAAGSDFSCEVFKGEVISYSSADSMGLGFRGLFHGKMGYASTQVLDEDAIDFLVEGAKTNAQLIESEDEEFLYPGSGEYAQVETYHPALEKVTAAEKLELCRRMEQLTLGMSDKVPQVEGCEIMSEMHETAIVNTRGLKVSGKGNLLGAYIAPLAKDGDKVNSGYKFAFTQDVSALDVESLVQNAVREAVDGLNAVSAPSGDTPVCIRGDAMADLLSTFSGVFSAKNAQKDLSLLKGREGEVIAAECVTILDDPHMPHMAASTAFDGEGVATRVKKVVDGGKLTTLLHNLKTAKRQGVETTGNASRPSYSSSVGVAPTNFYVQPSETAPQTLFQEMGDGLLITSVQGLHAGANAISGDFSLAAKGYFVREGKVSGAANGITIAGNFFDLLKNITAVANDLTFTPPSSSTFGSPTVWVSSLAVAGSADA